MASFDDFNFPRIPETHMRMNPVLPLVYDDSLSYYEAIQKCMARINEITDLVNSFNVNEAFIQQSKEYTDKVLAQAVENINNRFTTIEADIDNIRTQHQQDINELHSLIISETNRLQAEMTRLYQVMKDFNQTVDWKMEQVRQELLDFIKNQILDIESLYVTSPVTGKWVPIQTALYDLYNLIVSFWSLTAGEYDELQLTAEQYDNLQLTAYQYDNLARWYLWDYFKGRMWSPFTGKWELYSTIIDWLTNLHRDRALTAGEYDSLDLTAGEYDAYKLTAWEYDWYGKERLSPSSIKQPTELQLVLLGEYNQKFSEITPVTDILPIEINLNFSIGDFNTYALQMEYYNIPGELHITQSKIMCFNYNRINDNSWIEWGGRVDLGVYKATIHYLIGKRNNEPIKYFPDDSSLNIKIYAIQLAEAGSKPPTPNTFYISVQPPAAVTVEDGEEFSIGVTAFGEGLTYQWQQMEPEHTVWVNIPASTISATTQQLHFIASATHNGDKYRCIIKNIAGKTLTSSECTLTVTTSTP